MAFPYQEVVLTQKDSSPVKYLTLNPDKMSKLSDSSGVFNTQAKITVENAKAGGGLVHIRSSNNKYWVRAAPSEFIKSQADAPNEDKSSPQCTLFRTVVQGGNTLRLVHVQLGRDVGRLNQGDSVDCLTMQTSNVVRAEFNIIDYQSLVKLPKRVAFKGNNNNLLGRYQYDPSSPHYHQFSKSDLADPLTMYEVVPAKNGDIRVKTRDLSRVWKLGDNSWIWSNSPFTDSNENNPNFMFEVVKIAPNVVALRNRGNNQFCKRLTTDGMTDCLAAATSTITNVARLEVIEPLIERKITVTHFRLDEARIYNNEVILVATKQATNNSSTADKTSFKFSEKVTDTSSWSNSLSLTTRDSFSITSGIPKLGIDSEIKVESEINESYTWGKEMTKERSIEETYEANIPSKSKVTVKLLAKKGTCDIPYSYTQSDRYTDGTKETYTVEDGIYTGVNAYVFYYEKTEEPLSALELAHAGK